MSILTFITTFYKVIICNDMQFIIVRRSHYYPADGKRGCSK